MYVYMFETCLNPPNSERRRMVGGTSGSHRPSQACWKEDMNQMETTGFSDPMTGIRYSCTVRVPLQHRTQFPGNSH